jgi:hypothetical protein
MPTLASEIISAAGKGGIAHNVLRLGEAADFTEKLQKTAMIKLTKIFQVT